MGKTMSLLHPQLAAFPSQLDNAILIKLAVGASMVFPWHLPNFANIHEGQLHCHLPASTRGTFPTLWAGKEPLLHSCFFQQAS